MSSHLNENNEHHTSQTRVCRRVCCCRFIWWWCRNGRWRRCTRMSRVYLYIQHRILHKTLTGGGCVCVCRLRVVMRWHVFIKVAWSMAAMFWRRAACALWNGCVIAQACKLCTCHPLICEGYRGGKARAVRCGGRTLECARAANKTFLCKRCVWFATHKTLAHMLLSGVYARQSTRWRRHMMRNYRATIADIIYAYDVGPGCWWVHKLGVKHGALSACLHSQNNGVMNSVGHNMRRNHEMNIILLKVISLLVRV